MPRALRSTVVLSLALALVAALAVTAVAARAPRVMQPQQLQATGNGTATLDGNLAVLGWVDAGRRSSIRVVDRAGDGRVVFQGRNIPIGRRGQARIPGGGGRFLVTGTRIMVEVRGNQQINASGVGVARLRGEGEYSIADGDEGEWEGDRIAIGVVVRPTRNDRDNTAPAAPAPPPAPTPAPAPPADPSPAPAVPTAPEAIGGAVPDLLSR